MALFGRGRRGSDDTTAPESSDSPAPGDLHVPDETPPGPDPAAAPIVREVGPWDEGQAYPDLPRLDLGGVLIPQNEHVRIQVQADPNSGTVSQLSLVTEVSAVQVQPYAAPRSGGMWEDIRGQIKSSINSAGGLVEETSGVFGVELRAQVTNAEGKPQPARFAGVDGPRWFVRMVFLGQAARDPQAAAPLEEVISQMVVVRGGDAMPMGNAIPLRVPVEQTGEAAAAPANTSDRPTITLPERGPEITETR